MDICDAWAEKRGFTTAKGCRPDSYRAANELLRLSVEGKLVFCLRPPGYDDEGSEEEEDDEEEVEEDDDDDAELETLAKMVRNIQTAKKRKAMADPVVKVKEGSENNNQEEGDSDEKEESEEESPQAFSSNAFALLGEEND